MGRKRLHKNRGLEDNVYPNGKYFIYVNPITKQRYGIGSNKALANKRARLANARLVPEDNVLNKILGLNDILLQSVIQEYIEKIIPLKAWGKKTKEGKIFSLNRIDRELGQKTIHSLDRVFLGKWLEEKTPSAEAFNKNRTILVDLWKYAISQRYVDINEPDAVIKKSTSKKILDNKRQRERMTVDQFWGIHNYKNTPKWIQRAMRFSLITLQARNETLKAKWSDYRDGWLYVVRDKTSTESDMSFIRIKVEGDLEKLLNTCWNDRGDSPFIINRIPKRNIAFQNREHYTQIEPHYFSTQFREYRNATGLFDDFDANRKPPFHEIRSLGSRIYRALGYDERYIQYLMTHSDKSTTEIYLSGGEITDDRFIKVRADLKLSDLPSI